MKRKLRDVLAGTVGRLLTLGQPDEVPLDDVRDLRQTDEVWESTVRRARIWITPPDEEPYRPYMVLTVSQNGKLCGTHILDEGQPKPIEVINALAKAMRYPAPGAGGKRRPTAIHMDDEALVEALAPKLQEVGVRCKYRHTLHEAEYAFSEMERFMGDEEPIPGLLEVPGVTPFMAEGLFEAAAYFYREAPWRWLDDGHPIEMRYPVDSEPRYAVVMGHGGQTYGLALYNSTEILRKTYAGTPPDQLIGQDEWIALLFGEAIEMSFDDLDAIEKYDWAVAGQKGYPLILQVTRSGQPIRPGKSELLRLEAALLAVPRFVEDQMAADEDYPRPAEKTLTVAMADGEDDIHLRYPVPGFGMPYQSEWMAITEDEEEKAEAARERNDELLDAFEQWLIDKGLSEKTIEEHLDNVGLFADAYMADEGGSFELRRPADQAAAVDVDEFLADWFLYEAAWASVRTVKRNIASLKKFYACLKETEQMPAEEADEILTMLREDRDYYLELAQDFEEEMLGD